MLYKYNRTCRETIACMQNQSTPKKLGPHRTGHCLMATGARTRRLLASVIDIFISRKWYKCCIIIFSCTFFFKLLVSHCNFLFIPCGRLSWLPVSFLLHTIVSYRIVIGVDQQWSCVDFLFL